MYRLNNIKQNILPVSSSLKKFYTLLFTVSIAVTSAQAATLTVEHTIKRGDTLSSIAYKHHTTVKALKKTNCLKNAEIIKLGEVLKVPKRTTKIKNRVATSRVTADKEMTSKRATKIIALAKQKLGRKYVWGAVGKRNTFDCSGLTKYVYNKNGIKIPRTSLCQSKHGKKVSRSQLQPGDLVFFDTSKKRKGYVNHVGIYIGNDQFLHASSAKKKVIITSLNRPFYSSRFTGARRPS